jgi:thymidylate synthase
VPNSNDARIESNRSPSYSIRADGIGEAWIAVCQQIVQHGAGGTYDGLAMRELLMVTLTITHPRGSDRLIERWGEPERLAWMKSNFTELTAVEALGDADSYATRLRDYEHAGRDQVRWVIERLLGDPSTRSATITTLQPLSDASYIPCVSLLDFFLVHGRLQLAVYAHSIDFGTKGFANLVELARLQEEVARAVDSGIGPLTMIVKSAHVYSTELDHVQWLLTESPPD